MKRIKMVIAAICVLLLTPACAHAENKKLGTVRSPDRSCVAIVMTLHGNVVLSVGNTAEPDRPSFATFNRDQAESLSRLISSALSTPEARRAGEIHGIDGGSESNSAIVERTPSGVRITVWSKDSVRQSVTFPDPQAKELQGLCERAAQLIP